jgi:hypothetical protein
MREIALRFSRSDGGPFLAEYANVKIPPRIEWPRLRLPPPGDSAERALIDTDTDEYLRLLLARDHL